MYEKKIIQLIEKMDDNERKEVLDFVEFIKFKHIDKSFKQNQTKENPLLQLAGFVEIDKISSRDIDKELY